MTFSTKKLALTVLALATVLGMSTGAVAQLNSGAQTINLNATLAESLTLALNGNTVNFTLLPGSPTNAGSTTIMATTTWVLRPGRTHVTINAYFSSANALSDGAGNNIPNTAFTIADNAGAATPLTAVTPYSNFGYQMADVTITGANKNSSRTDTMAFNIDLSGGTLPQLPAGTYTGVLYIQAQATP